MLLRQMKTFQSVVETGSFTEAAEACYISQSAVSQQIAALESELGVRLLERRGRRVFLTEAGEFFYKRSLVVTADLEQLCRETKRRGRGEGERFRVGVPAAYDGDELGRALSAFARERPGAEAEVFRGNHEDLYDALREGRADLVLNDQRRAFSDQYENRVLRRTGCLVEVSVHSPISRLEAVEIGDLKYIPCILVASEAQEREEEGFYREIIGFTGEFLFARSLQEARTLVVSNRGVFPVEGGARGAFATFKRMPLLRGGEEIARNLCLFCRRDNGSAPARAFADLLAAQFAGEEA